MFKKRKITSVVVRKPKPKFLKGVLAAAVGISIVVCAPVRGQVPPGASEVWPTNTLETIQATVDGGGVVYFHPGTYNWTGILNVNNSVELTGPKPVGDFNTGTGTDNRIWEAKITKTPPGTDVWDPTDPIIQITCPSNTENVIISNLEIECLSMGMCILLEGGGDSIKITKCRIKTVDDGYGIIAWEAGDVSVVVEDCYIEAGTAGFLKPDGTPPNTDCIAFGMSNFSTIEVRNNIAINNCDTLDVSVAVELVWHQEPNTQVTISNNWLKSSGEGFTIFYYSSACPIGTVSHNTIVGHYNFLHLDNSGIGGTIKSNKFECNGGGRGSFYFSNSSDVTVQGNEFTGSVSLGGIVLIGNSSHNVFVGNNMSNLNAGAAQIVIQPGAHGNLFTRNVIGPLAPEAIGGIVCRGADNDIIRNDYVGSNIPGLGSSDLACVILGAASEGNLVFESGGLPPGTGGSTEHVLDLTREPPSQGPAGTTTNIVVGHSADVLAEDLNPGVGQRVKDALAMLD